MKSIKPFIIGCVALMAIASIAGAISYMKASNAGLLNEMYNDPTTFSEVKQKEVIPSDSTTINLRKSESTASVKNPIKERIEKLYPESFSRAAIDREFLDSFGTLEFDSSKGIKPEFLEKKLSVKEDAPTTIKNE